jgi:hypothetical protein
VLPAVDKERRGALHPAADAAYEVFPNPSGVGAPGKIRDELRLVQPDRGGVPDQILLVERVLVIEQRIVHRPELALRPGRLRRALGVRVGRGEREVAENQPHPRAESALQLLDDRLGLAADWALIITVWTPSVTVVAICLKVSAPTISRS